MRRIGRGGRFTIAARAAAAAAARAGGADARDLGARAPQALALESMLRSLRALRKRDNKGSVMRAFLWSAKRKRKGEVMQLAALIGAVVIIDWELSPKPQVLPFQPLATVHLRLSNQPSDPGFGRYRMNPMIGDRGTQCDTMFKDCLCNFPFEFLMPPAKVGGAYIANYHCNLFGVPLDRSWEVADSLAEELSDPPPGRNLSLYWGPSYHKLRADGLLVPHLAISLQRERLEEWSPSARTEL